VTRERLKALLKEYGQVAIYTYFALFFVVLAGFGAAMAWGAGVESSKGGLAVIGAAWLATKATQPIRIAATLGLTPLVAAALHKLGLRKLPNAAAAPTGVVVAASAEPPSAEVAPRGDEPASADKPPKAD